MNDRFHFYLRVRYGECDAQKVVFNSRYSDYADVSCMEFLRAVGLGKVVTTGGLDFQVVKQTLEWKSSARFDQVLSQYEHAPAVTRERMYLEAMENVYKNSRKVIVDTKNGNSMMYLPLDKLIAPGPQSIAMPNDTLTVPPARTPEIQVAPPEDPARARGVR